VIGCAVFDLDGTLIDSVPLCADILNAMLADRGLTQRLSWADVRPHAAAGGAAMIGALLGGRCGPPDAALGEFRERYASLPTPADCLYPGVREALAALRRGGVGLALVSNKAQPLCEKVLDDLELTPMFAAVVGSGPAVPLKPNPAGFALALARVGGTRERCCYVGDSGVDYALAQTAGVPLVMVSWGYGEAGRPWPGAAMVDDFAAIVDVVPGLLRSRAAA
jgi:phosphoglycolate phosphatase